MEDEARDAELIYNRYQFVARCPECGGPRQPALVRDKDGRERYGWHCAGCLRAGVLRR